ncbi:MAG: MoxR family ATPase [Opitutales bacterium]|jgi:MoxR-like ATPase|nr:MoxR family ATPase [Opitutales bacterium]MDP4645058.1 MoxR family ATPase [Opitutales bacterium]MDP4694020.1 MoxR family ATPase [Opitutales bacterium]MDP4776905.1 MoxR family ATPase [Opitutales bacterium]MDP4883554.1 MoxR family ATPase [Opitutales bacterium]
MSSKTVIPAPRAIETVERLRKNIERTIRGKTEAVDKVITCLLAGGHILIEDLPGLGKTTLAYCLARSIDCSFSRIQFTSDMLPSDIIGVSIYDEREREFTFKRGPIFANVVLADEINRTTPKTQSSLLEVMGRAKISVDGQTYTVPPPFMVIATQNPVDYEGTFPLPESQMDRFLMRIEMGYPDFEYELDILKDGHLHYDNLEASPVVSKKEILELQGFTRDVFIEDTVYEYIVKLVTATRAESEFRSGVSPRGTLSLKAAAQAQALAQGRAFVVPEDVQALVLPVWGHRLALRKPMSDPMEERRSVEGLLQKIVEATPEPT